MTLFQTLIDDPKLGITIFTLLLFSLTLHEFAHAYVAHLCGDNTAKQMGRMTINPLVHLDPIGSALLLFVGFGYAKPVPVNPRNYRFKSADLFVSAAGPAMNFLLAFVGTIVHLTLVYQTGGVDQFTGNILFIFVLINLVLCFFNLIPLGPLDGSYVLPYILPKGLRYNYRVWNARFGTGVILGLLLLSYVAPSLSPFRWIFEFSRLIMGFLRVLIQGILF